MISVNLSLISSGVLASFRYSSAMRLLAEEAWNREGVWTISVPFNVVPLFLQENLKSSKKDDFMTLSTTDPAYVKQCDSWKVGKPIYYSITHCVSNAQI